MQVKLENIIDNQTMNSYLTTYGTVWQVIYLFGGWYLIYVKNGKI